MNAPGERVGERRGATQEMIDKLLHERQQLLVLFVEIVDKEHSRREPSSLETLQAFCEVLVDYSAFCHFEIYERILNGKERRGNVMEVAEEVYPRIAEASEVAVEFNDRYDADDHQLELDKLDHDLDVLGKELAARFEMEDKIISALLQR